VPVPAVPPYIIEPIFQQFRALLPERKTSHPLGCHRPRIPDRVVFEKLVQVLVFGCAYEKIADGSCSATTLRDRRDEWIELGVIERLREMTLEAYDRAIGLDLSELAVDCCITKAPCGGEKAGRSPVDRGKRGLKRSVVVDGRGIPIGSVTAPASRHDSPLLVPTLDAARALGMVLEGATVHLDRGYDSKLTRLRLLEFGLVAEISRKGRPAPLNATRRWVIERTNSWNNAHKKLLWCTERCGRVVDFWMALSAVVVEVRRLVREGWTRYRWDGRPSRRP
jgi:transposase